MSYNKPQLLQEIKASVKTKTKEPIIPEGWTGKDEDYNKWAKEVIGSQPAPATVTYSHEFRLPPPKRSVSEQY